MARQETCPHPYPRSAFSPSIRGVVDDGVASFLGDSHLIEQDADRPLWAHCSTPHAEIIAVKS
jgi:hypothetical protein